jgi:hypothetical protein
MAEKMPKTRIRPVEREDYMNLKRGLVLSLSAAGLILLTSARGFAFPQQAQSQQQAEQAKSVSGKVASIAPDKKSITLEVNNGNDRRTMQFVVNQNTQVTARVSTGSMATVQYEPTNDNQLVALVISPQDTR